MIGMTREQIELLNTLLDTKNKKSFIIPTELANEVLSKQNVNLTDNTGNTLLHHALLHANLELVKGLIALNAEFTSSLLYGRPLEMALAFKSDIEIIKALLQKKDINFDKEVDGLGKNLISQAIENKASIDIIKTFIEAGIDINQQDYMSKTPLMYAINSGNPELVEMLLSNSTLDINQDNFMYGTPLIYALDSDADPKIIEILLSREEIDVDRKKGRKTALDIAKEKDIDQNIVAILEKKSITQNSTQDIQPSLVVKKINPLDEEIDLEKLRTSYAPPIRIKKIEPQFEEYTHIPSEEETQETPLSLKLFSHINNDAHLIGTRTLEGEEFKNTITFLSHFISEIKQGKTSFPPQLLQLSQIERLEEKLNEMLVIVEGINTLTEDIMFVPEEERKEKYLDFAHGIAQKIQDMPEGVNEKSIFFPGGWSGEPSGHAMVYEFRKDKDGNIVFLIYNSGAGLDNHIKIPSADKDRYIPVAAFQIPKNSVTLENLKFFITEITKPRVESRIRNYDITRNRVYNADRLYHEAIASIAYLDGKAIDPREVDLSFKEIITMGQRSGTCTEKVLHELIKGAMPNPLTARTFIFCLKKYSIEKFSQQTYTLNNKDVEQIKLAIENLARIIEKDPTLLPEEVIEETYSLIRRIITSLPSTQPEITPIVLDLTLAEKAKTVQTFTNASETNFLKPTPLKYTPPQEKLPEAVNVESYSQEHIQHFIQAIQGFKQSQHHEALVDSIDNFLFGLSLNINDYAKMQPKDATKFIQNISALLILYGESCQHIDPQQSVGPKRVITLLNAQTAIRLCATQAIKSPKGSIIPFWSFYHKSMLGDLNNNSFLETKDQKFDQKLIQINAAEESIKIAFDHLKVYSRLIKEHPHENSLKKFLTEIFDKEAPKRFTTEEIAVLKEKDLCNEVALIEFLNEQTTPEEFYDILEMITLKRNAENFSKQIDNFLKEFDYSILKSIETNPTESSINIYASHKTVSYGNQSSSKKLNAKLMEWGHSIENKNVTAALEADFGDAEYIFKPLGKEYSFQIHDYEKERNILFHPNFIYSQPNGPQEDTSQKLSAKQSFINKAMWNLRSSPSLQIMATIDFFSENIELLSQKEYQLYFEKNIFQPGLLLKSLETNPKIFDKINEFIEQGITYYTKEGEISETAIFFYQLKYAFHQYFFNSQLSPYDNLSTTHLSELKNNIEKIAYQNLTIASQTTLSFTYIKTCLQLLKQQHSPNEETLFNVFQHYLNYKTTLRELPALTAEAINQDAELRKEIVELFKKNQEKIPSFITRWQKSQGTNELPVSAIWENNFPFYTVKDEKDNTIVNFDLNTGEIRIKGELISKIPFTLAATPLYQDFYGKTALASTVTPIVHSESGTVAKQFKIINDDNKGYFIETPHLSKPFAYHCSKAVNGKEIIFELQTLVDKKNPKDPSTSNLGAQEQAFALPKSFFDASTRYWQGKTGESLIERSEKKYFITTENNIKELDENLNETGYALLNLQGAQDKLDNTTIEELYSLFSQFEDPSMIEILIKENDSIQGPEVKIYFPRYNLELHGVNQEKQWEFTLSHDPQLILKPNQNNPLPHLKAPLIFEHKINKEEIALIPFQEFYVKKDDQTFKSIDSMYHTAYFNFSFDNHQKIKEDTINKKDDKQEDIQELSLNKPWNYVASESYFTIAIDKNLNQFKAQDTHEALYLSYLCLCQYDPDTALQYINQIINKGGLKGTQKEIEIIEKIIHGVPRSPDEAKISNPKYIAVRAHTLSLISHHLAKGNKFNLEKNVQEKTNSKSDLYQEKHNKNIQKFFTNLNGEIEKNLYQYHHIKRNIPSRMLLANDQELEMLSLIHFKKKAKGPLGTRFRQLRAEKLAKELAYLREQNNTKPSLVQRQLQVEEKLKKTKKVTRFASSIDNVLLPVITPRTFESTSEEITSSFEVVSLLAKPTLQMVLPTPGMTDHDFITNFMHYYRLARMNEDSLEKQQLKHFCENAILATAQLSSQNARSLIPHFAGILLKALHSPEDFATYSLPEYDNYSQTSLFVEQIFSCANNINLSLPMTSLKKLKIQQIYKTPDSYQSLPTTNTIRPTTFSHKDLDTPEFVIKANMVEFIAEYKNERIQLEEKIQSLIKEKYPDSKSFETDFPEITALDQEIGRMRNEFNIKVQQLTLKYLNADKIREKIEEETKQFSYSAHERLAELEKNILALANLGPSDPYDKLMFDLQHFGQSRQKLDIRDIYRLYVLSDKNEYQKATGLSDENISKLHQDISDFIYLSILTKGYERKKKALEKCRKYEINTPEYESAFAELGTCLTEENLADFASQPEIQFFQKEEGFLVFPQSIKYLEILLQADPQTLEFKNEIIRLAMGAGKSKVLSPLAAIKKANGTNLVIHQVKSSLFNTNYADLNATSLKLFNQEAIPFQFDRNSPSTSEDLKQIYHQFHQVMVGKKYLVTSGESLQSLELKYLELLLCPPIPTEDVEKSKKALQEWERQIKWLDKTLIMIKQRGDRIIDEIHDELDPKKLLNYTLGLPIDIPKEDIKLEVELFYFFQHIQLEDILNIPNTSLFDILQNNIPITPAELWQLILIKLAENIVTHPDSPIAQSVAKLNLNEEDSALLSDYLLNKSDEILGKFSTLNQREKDEIAFLKKQISDILPFTLQKKLFEHYGPSKKTTSVASKVLPIPYKSNNTPNERARFGHFIEYMNYTMMMAAKTDLPDDLMREIINDFLEQAKTERLDSPSLTFDKTLASIQFESFFIDGNITLEMLAQKNETYYQLAFTALRKSSAFKKYCLKEVILPQIKINPTVLSSDSQNAAVMTRTNQGMDGTPWNYLAQHQDFHFEPQESIGTDGETVDILRKKNTQVHFLESVNNPFNLLQEIIPRLANAEHLQAIIDVGALFRGISNENVAREIANYFTSVSNNHIQYVLYYDNDEEILYAFDIKNKEKIKLDTTNEAEISKRLKCPPDQRFTYYDQVRTTGTDIVQDAYAHALVTVNEKTPKYAFLQGVKRMRQVAKDQSITLVGPNYLKLSLPPKDSDLNSVLELVELNQIQESLQVHLRSAPQKFKNVIRENLLQKIYETKDPSKKSELLRNFENYFTYTYKPEHFINFGDITTLQDTTLYLQNLESGFYSNWQELIKKTGLTLSEKDELTLKNALEKVKVQCILACPKTSLQSAQNLSSDYSSTATSHLGFEMEFQTDLQAELENELENEMQQELDLEQVQLFFEENVNPNLSEGFSLKEGLTNKPGILLSLNEALTSGNVMPNFSFSENIHITEQFAKTHDKQKQFLSGYTKPIEVIMMVTSKTNPKELNAVIMTKKEAAKIIDSINTSSATSHLRIWMVSPRGTPLGGNPPEKMPEDYSSFMEQIRYINGDCQLLSQQKEPLIWLNEDSEEKMRYLSQQILPVHAHKASHFKHLSTRVDVMNKIFHYIVEYPTDDFSKINFNKLYPEFNSLNKHKKQVIYSLVEAYQKLNGEFILSSSLALLENQNNFEKWIKQFPEEIHHLIINRKNTLNTQKSILSMLSLKIPLEGYKAGAFDFATPDGQTPLQKAILAGNMTNFEYILHRQPQSNISFEKTILDCLHDPSEENIPFLMKVVEKSYEKGVFSPVDSP
ncbi:MAG: hypothetical protein BGO43_08485 [Gammaproteobacteria bacterium 39-13]|nr:ankyrin repeat domain-containing protein [Gammaproteobacteria bacterium]OJV94287.1 MAG: hypothetical protein BGO43_08485 [Gammaproteobacteria bacterium 39-13]